MIQTALFVPGDRPERFGKAEAARPDLVVIDLEDAVDPADKGAARVNAASWIREHPSSGVRVNAFGTEFHDADIAAFRGLGALVMLPKASDPTSVAMVRDGLDGAPMLPLIETAAGIRNAYEVLAVPGVVLAAFGSIDLAAELGVSMDDRTALLHARSTIVTASAAAGRAAPLDGVTVEIHDSAGVADDAEYARSLGFGGKLCIHPVQLDAARRAFRPKDDEIAWATRILSASPSGRAVSIDGAMIDEAVLIRARSILRRARQ